MPAYPNRSAAVGPFSAFKQARMLPRRAPALVGRTSPVHSTVISRTPMRQKNTPSSLTCLGVLQLTPQLRLLAWRTGGRGDGAAKPA